MSFRRSKLSLLTISAIEALLPDHCSQARQDHRVLRFSRDRQLCLFKEVTPSERKMDDSLGSMTINWLDQAGDALGGIPQWALLFGHCAFCATLADDLKDRYLLHYWV